MSYNRDMAELSPIDWRQKFEALRKNTRTKAQPESGDQSGSSGVQKDWTTLGSGGGPAKTDKPDWTQLGGGTEAAFETGPKKNWTQLTADESAPSPRSDWTQVDTPATEAADGWLRRAMQTASTMIMGPTPSDWIRSDLQRPQPMMGLTPNQNLGGPRPQPNPGPRMGMGGRADIRQAWDGDWSAAMSAYKHLSPRASGADLVEDYTMEEPDSLYELTRRIGFLEKRIGQLSQVRNEDVFGQMDAAVNELQTVQVQLQKKRAERAGKQRQQNGAENQHQLVSDELQARDRQGDGCEEGYFYSAGLGGYGTKKQTRNDLEWQKQQLQIEVNQLKCEVGRLDSEIPDLESRQAALFNQLETLQARMSAEPARNRQQVNDFLIYYENQLAHLQHVLSRVNGGFDGYFR